MIDIKLLRNDLEGTIAKLKQRGADFNYLREVIALDNERRAIIAQVETLKKERNDLSKQIGLKKRQGEDSTDLLKQVGSIGDKIQADDQKLVQIEKQIEAILLITPNLLHESVPFGRDEKDNVEIKKYLEPTKFAFTPKAHYELGEDLDILDFGRAAKIAGSRFVVYKGLGARLERALIAFMMDLHSANGYQEIIPPYIANRESMTATGQLPKFEEDAFRLVNGNGDWFLNPTAEVPTINMYRDEVIDIKDLPLNFVSYTMAFRSEAGSAGRDTRGLIRTHQFNKVELIKLTAPEDSYQEHEAMLQESEKVLQTLAIPYRVITLCSGDMGFAMAKTYDIEVWLPSQNTYREIGSISNAEDYQARRGNIRMRRSKDAKLEFVHTLNGSGLAVGRTWVALVENYQQADGSIKIPKALIPYMGCEYIGK
ncbi:MAG TPA: serine--tRNA ligase [Bacilli bacterium]|nr:MAG: Serine--tRNA ligase [Tenericutes bacterium ADurb.BinA124]HNZ49992.1 serine--tRNA ligase [Bacilli bacterium]HOH17684.1 serine--tRNA ligase [Bacilli bacterium]HPN60583.1 serine--tRNA ligase [Bacilli bacterium]HPX84260.1 serine--tRNA ligase [Bacilli bacterium]